MLAGYYDLQAIQLIGADPSAYFIIVALARSTTIAVTAVAAVAAAADFGWRADGLYLESKLRDSGRH